MAKKERIKYKDDILKLKTDGLNLSKIAEVLNINRLDVKIVLQENNVYEPRKKFNSRNEHLQKLAIEMYTKNNMSLREIEEKLDFPRQEVSKLLKKNNLELKTAGLYNRKYSLNELSFSNYTPESAYWAGFIAGDGCVYSHGLGGDNKENNYLNVSLAIIDEEHLMSFKKFLNYNGVLYYRKDGKAVGVTVNSKNIVKDLNDKYNITNNKTDIYVPPENIPSDLVKYFILGLIDSDGCITSHLKTYQPKTKRYRGDYIYQMNFTGTKESCEFVKAFFGSKVKLSKRKDNETNNYTVIFQGNEQVNRFCSILYDEISVDFCLQRKYKKYVALKEQYSTVV